MAEATAGAMASDWKATLYLAYFVPILVAVGISGEYPTASAGLTIAVTTLHFLAGLYELVWGETSLKERYTVIGTYFVTTTRGQALSNLIADALILGAWIVGVATAAGDRYLALTGALLALSGNIFCYVGRG